MTSVRYFKINIYQSVKTYVIHNPTLIYSGTLRVWELDRDNRKIRPTDVTMGQLKRVVKCIQVWFQKLLSNLQHDLL